MPTSRDDLVHRVARRSAELRVARGMTQEQLGQRLGISAKNVQRMELGRQNLTLRTLDTLAGALAVDAIVLLAPPGSGLPWVSDGGLGALLAALATVGLVASSVELPRPRGAVPLLTLRAAASPPIANEEPEVLAWLVPRPGTLRPSAGSFVARVSGASMEPLIPSGALCLFRPVRGNDYGERIVLVQHRGILDLDTGGSYAVKRIGAVDRTRGRIRVRLDSTNRRYRPITIDVASDAELRPVAEFDRVLWSPMSAERIARRDR